MSTGTPVPDADERQRAQRAVELRVAGTPYAAIATSLGYADESGARHAVRRTLDRREAEGVALLRDTHSARLEAVLAAWWPAALAGNIDAARVVGSTLDRIAKLWGLDAPSRLAVATMSNDEFAAEAAGLIASIAAMSGGHVDVGALTGVATPPAVVAGELVTALPADDPGESCEAASGPHSAATGDVIDVEGWSNIDGPTDTPAGDDTSVANDLDGVPRDVLAAIAGAADDDAAAAVLAAHRAGRTAS